MEQLQGQGQAKLVERALSGSTPKSSPVTKRERGMGFTVGLLCGETVLERQERLGTPSQAMPPER